ncbi:hypothetical protein [Pseudomonas luteola]|uniref:hypothetical protein n=1 Tax=Pseudomonas luteola TaxID=47886 RepID=UPI003DA05D0B
MPVQESCECCGDNLKAGQTGECDFCRDEGLLIDLCGGLDTQAYQLIEEIRRTGDDARFNPVTTAKQLRFDISKATPKLLERSAAMSDMDEALIVIQSACGIETGDLAGLFFSGEQWSETTGTDWVDRGEAERLRLLYDYLAFEQKFRAAFSATSE